MMSLVLSLALEAGAVGVVTGPDMGRPPVVQSVPAPPDAGVPAPPPAGSGGVVSPDQARHEAQVARQVQSRLPGSRVLGIESQGSASRVRVLHNGQVREVFVPH